MTNPLRAFFGLGLGSCFLPGTCIWTRMGEGGLAAVLGSPAPVPSATDLLRSESLRTMRRFGPATDRPRRHPAAHQGARREAAVCSRRGAADARGRIRLPRQRGNLARARCTRGLGLRPRPALGAVARGPPHSRELTGPGAQLRLLGDLARRKTPGNEQGSEGNDSVCP